MRGFSTIEIVFSIAILGALLVTLGALVSTVPLERTSHNQSIALAGAGSEIENLREDGYANLPASGSFTNGDLSELPQGAGTLSVSTYDSETKELAVTVSWQIPGQPVQSVTLTTLITSTGGLP